MPLTPIKLSSIFFICLLLFSSCEFFEKERRNEYVTYTIPAGENSSTTKVSTYSGNQMNFLAKFDPTSIYSTSDPINQYDINKLYGFSDCSSLHHINSARFGWRWFDNHLEIHAYCYINSLRISQFITFVDLNEEYQYSIITSDQQYVFTVNGISVTMPRGCSGTGGTKYRLYPYYGGDEKAPHEINIKIKEL
jgi:hypothetical protein